MPDQPIRVLIADDSALFRELIRDAIQQSPQMVVAGVAKNGEEALAEAIRLQPDVITLDVQMPKMDGLKALEAILAIRPVPVVMVSSLTAPEAECSLRSMEIGAIDCIAKPSEDLNAFRAELMQKLRALAGVDVRRMLESRRARRERQSQQAKPVLPTTSRATQGCIAIGISTGGPPVLTELFAALAPPMPPIVVVQHMPGAFTGPFARRLDGISALRIREAPEGAEIRPNEVLIAPGGRHLRLRRDGNRVVVKLADHEPVSGHRPSIDVMMSDIASLFGTNCLGVIMTGMGVDGVAGCRAIRERGGDVLGQDQATSAVYGMNKAAFTAGLVTRQFGVHELPQLLQQCCLGWPDTNCQLSHRVSH
jgi:two-component system chemotaxis response regulator CheB